MSPFFYFFILFFLTLYIQQSLAVLLSIAAQLEIWSREDRKYIYRNERFQAAFHAAAQGATHFSLILFSLDLTFHQQMAPLGWLMQFDAIYCISSGLPKYLK